MIPTSETTSTKSTIRLRTLRKMGCGQHPNFHTESHIIYIYIILFYLSIYCLFPTCQVRVVSEFLSELFFSSSSSSSSFSSTTSASTSMSNSALPTLRQALRQLPHAVGTAGPQLQGSERTGHCWTSTWNLPSSVSTAGPQPGTFRAQ